MNSPMDKALPLLPDSGGPYLVVAAHPDDEVIGLGSCFPDWAGRVIVLHATDGSPADLRDARAAGFSGAGAYAAARQAEVRKALSLAGIDPQSIACLGFRDQELGYQLAQFTSQLVRLLREIGPSVVFSHAYEGGHPDHDAVSFGVAAALGLSGIRAQHLEFSCYHARGDRLVTSEFLPSPATPVCTKILDAPAREMKARMIDAFVTQRHLLQVFPQDVERIRPAPAYNYHAPPHPGRLYYEGRISKLTGMQWRGLARAAAIELNL